MAAPTMSFRVALGPPLRTPVLRLAVVALSAVCASGCTDRRSGVDRAAELASRDGASTGGDVSNGTAVPATSIRFAERAKESGIDFTYRNGQEAGRFAILESLGGGAGLLDFDADGRLDVFLPGGGRFGGGREVVGLPSGLFRGLGAGRFVQVAAAAGAAGGAHYSHGAAVGDFDGDGFPDVVVTGYGGLQFFRNQGDGTFREGAGEAGLDDRLWSSSAAWGDIDCDGDLDLYVAHYVDWSFDNNPVCVGGGPEKRDVCPPRQFSPLDDVLYLNSGDGTLRDASKEVGLSPGGKGLGVLMADVDLDGDLDVYVGNDTVPNFLYRNDGKGHLADVSLMSGTALSDRGLPDGSMGVDLGDYDLDGLPDLWVANYENESFALYRNQGDCFFQHVSRASGVDATGAVYVGWGTVFSDFDADGDEDIFVSNGHVIRYPTAAPLAQKPLLFDNRGGKRLENVAPRVGDYFRASHRGRGVALGDLDGDGDGDLVVSRVDEPAAVLRNESDGGHPWLRVRLVGRTSNRDAVGAVVRLTTASGVQVRQRKSGTSYASSGEPALHFGLGSGGPAREIEVRWPSGTVQRQAVGPTANRTLTLVEPQPEPGR